MPKKIMILLFILLVASNSVVSAAENAKSDQTEAQEYALKMVYEYLGGERELNESELSVVNQIAIIYQDIKAEMAKNSVVSDEEDLLDRNGTSSNISFEVLAKQLLNIRGQFYEFFLTKNFGITNIDNIQENKLDEIDNGNKAD